MVYRHYFQVLNSRQQQLYRVLHQGLMQGDLCIDCGGIPPEQIIPVLRTILLDSPRLCHFEGKWEYRDAVFPHYTLPTHCCRLLEQEAERIRTELLAVGGLYHREAYLWLLEYVAYDLGAIRSQTAWGALMDRTAVCKGIAKAYQLLLQLQGIPCILVEGTLNGQARHVWNMVWIHKTWQHVDVTMGYPEFWHLVGARDALGGFCMDPTGSHTILYPHLLPSNKEE